MNNLKKVTKKLANLRDTAQENGKISAEEEKTLRSLIGEALDAAQTETSPLKKQVKDYIGLPENDNTPLTAEQKFRLRLMEKTGTGSISIH